MIKGLLDISGKYTYVLIAERWMRGSTPLCAVRKNQWTAAG